MLPARLPRAPRAQIEAWLEGARDPEAVKAEIVRERLAYDQVAAVVSAATGGP